VTGGFALLQANSKQEAIELVKQFLQVTGDGECEIRQLYEASHHPAENHVGEPAQAREPLKR
jgi:hypothetical protein